MRALPPGATLMVKEPRRFDKRWGHEVSHINNKDAGYSLKCLYLYPTGYCCSIHYHVYKTETFVVETGRMAIEIYGLKMRSPRRLLEVRDLVATGAGTLGRIDFGKPLVLWLKPDDRLTLDPFTAHRFWCMGETVTAVFEASTSDDPHDSYRILPSGRIPPDLVAKTKHRLEWEQLNPGFTGR